MATQISQGPWTRIRPLQRDELDPYTHAGMRMGEITWGIRNNLLKVMAYMPRMTQTEVEYCNSFIFAQESYHEGLVGMSEHERQQETGFNDRFLKELVISRTSLFNRSRYSVTHHAFMGYALYDGAGRGEEGHRKYLHLHEHDKHPDIYTERERVVLDYTVEVAQDPHLVTDNGFAELKRVLGEHNRDNEKLKDLSDEELSAHVDSQVVELTWLIGHYCMLNRWFTVLQVPDETAADEDDFLAAYEQVVPEDIRRRNEQLLAGGF